MSLRARLLEVLGQHGPLSLEDLSDCLSWEIDIVCEQLLVARDAGDIHIEFDGSVWLAKEDAA